MASTFYLRNYPAAFPCPTIKQSADEVYIQNYNLGSHAQYTSPQSLSKTIGSKPVDYRFSSDEPGSPHYHYFGTFVSDPLPAQTIAGTVTIGLALYSSLTVPVYPRIKVYRWTTDNKFGGDLLPLVTSSVAIPAWPQTALTIFYTASLLTSTSFNAGDKLVIEIEDLCDPAVLGIEKTWLDFNGVGRTASYLAFSQDIVTTIVPAPLPTAQQTPLIIYDSVMKPIKVIDDYGYLSWQRNWYTPDIWEMRINKNLPNADAILASRQLNATTLKWEYGGFVGISTALGKRIGLIDRIQLSLSEDGKGSEEYLVSGKGVEGILGTRIALYGTYAGDGYDTQTGPGETLLRHYIAQQCIGSGGTLPLASFMVTPNSGIIPLAVTVTNRSSGSAPLTYAWDYTNDGTVDSTDETPTGISYAAAGTYTLKLTVTNPYGSSIYTQQIRAQTGTGTVPITDFSASLVSGIVPLTVAFHETSLNSPTSWLWDFGDGVTSALQHPSHTYSVAGSYTVSLTATNGYGDDTETKTGYIVVTDPSGLPTYGAPSSLNGYAVGGALQVTSEGSTFGGGNRQYAIMTGDYSVTDLASLTAAVTAIQTLRNAGNNTPKTMYITPNASINTLNNAFNIPANVTIASNRGYAGSLGGLIYTTTPGSSWESPIFRLTGNNIHFTGLRLRGECYAESYAGFSESSGRIGIKSDGYSGIEIDNCELQGFAYGSIIPRNCSIAGTAGFWIHHNWIHDSQNAYEGYGISPGGGNCLIEGNVFDRNRHSVSGEARAGERFVIRYNRHLGHGYPVGSGTVFDAHSDGSTRGDMYEVYNNTVDYSASGKAGLFNVNQICTTGAYVHHNMYNGNLAANPDGFTLPVQQVGSDNSHMFCSYNYWTVNGVATLYPSNTGFVQ
jgi:PKD repeat protein